jgi:hypothetical protein
MSIVDGTRGIREVVWSAPRVARARWRTAALAILFGIATTPAAAVTICDNSVSPGFSAFVEQRNPGHWITLTGAGIEPATHICTANNRVGRLRNTPGQFNGGAILYKSSAAPGSARRNADVTFKVPTAADFLNWSHVAAFPAYYPDLGTGDPNAFGRIGAAVFKDKLYVQYNKFDGVGCGAGNPNLFPASGVTIPGGLQANRWYRLDSQIIPQPPNGLQVWSVLHDLSVGNVIVASYTQVFPTSCTPPWFTSATNNRWAVGMISAAPNLLTTTYFDDFFGRHE